MRFLHRVAGLSLRERVRSSDMQRQPGVELLLLGVKKEPAVVVQASDQDAAGTPPLCGVSGTSIRVKTPG